MKAPIGLKAARALSRRDFLGRTSLGALTVFSMVVRVPGRRRLAVLKSHELNCRTKCVSIDCNGCACGGDYYHCTGGGCDFWACATGHSCANYCSAC
jgi:hypothetical protein